MHSVATLVDHATLLLRDFVFYYPLFMAYVWMIGAVNFYFRFECTTGSLTLPRDGNFTPPVTVIIPMRNESARAAETIAQLLEMDYPEFEIIAVNDGSTDDTGEVLDAAARLHGRLRVVHLARNQGKALALEAAALVARHEFLICIDGDALLEATAARWMMRHFRWPRVAAVTGNPRIRNRSTLLGKIQVGEFSAIVGLIKRAQRTYGRLFTVSGVLAAFRKTALHDVGYWSSNMLTEDIDVTWKLEIRHWDVRYEPHALVWILMPETFAGLWSQRLRWAMGGVQVVLKYVRDINCWPNRRMWGIFIEFLLSIIWAYSIVIVVALWLIGWIVSLPPFVHTASPAPAWSGIVIGTTCLLQIGLSLMLDRHYDHRLGHSYCCIIWYPLVYWCISALTTVVAVPKVLARKRSARALWVSPDRGIEQPRDIKA
jgi:biofilm PGA synthesis N-glycosyltransferase PgaC